MGDDTSMKSVKEAFTPAFDEIASRKASAATQSHFRETTYFSKGKEDACLLPFVVPDQKFVLLSMGTPVLAPCPLRPETPSCRIYGCFPTRDDAREHAEVVMERDSKCSLMIVEQGEWCLFPINEKMRDDPVAAKERATAKIDTYVKGREEEKVDFEEVISSKDERKESGCIEREYDDPEEEKEMNEAERLVYAPPKRLRAGAEVRGQSCVAVSVVKDPYGEVCLRVYAAFETTSDAERWCRDVGSRRVVDFDISVAPTCDWFYPNGKEDTSTQEKYRNPELNKIMTAAAKNPQAVRDYKEWKKEEDRKYEEDKETRKAESESGVVEEEGGKGY